MGDCYYLSMKHKKVKKLIIRSEDLEMNIEKVNRFLSDPSIWFYEADLRYRKEQLKKDLMKLIKLIDNKDFE